MAETIQLAYQLYGTDGPPLVVMHGAFGAARNWISVARVLSTEYRVYLLDLRNHGSSPHAAVMDYPCMADDVVAWMEQQELPRALMLGHSMGGKLAMWLALRAPARVAGLIAVDIAPARYVGRDISALLAAMRALPIEQISSRPQAEAMLAERVESAAVRLFLLQNLRSSEGRYRWRIDLDVFSAALPALLDFPDCNGLPPYEGRALFLRGGNSVHVLPEHHAQIKALFPAALIDTIDGAGHWPHVDRPTVFVQCVREFLQTCMSQFVSPVPAL